jgi:hypothetical protein
MGEMWVMAHPGQHMHEHLLYRHKARIFCCNVSQLQHCYGQHNVRHRTCQRDLQYLPPGRQVGEVHQYPPGQSAKYGFVQVEGAVRAGYHHHSVWLNIALSSNVLWLTDFVAHINEVAAHIIPCDRKTACLRCYRERIATSEHWRLFH